MLLSQVFEVIQNTVCVYVYPLAVVMRLEKNPGKKTLLVTAKKIQKCSSHKEICVCLSNSVGE